MPWMYREPGDGERPVTRTVCTELAGRISGSGLARKSTPDVLSVSLCIAIYSEAYIRDRSATSRSKANGLDNVTKMSICSFATITVWTHFSYSH
jgi:hypothetical protein